jgi:fibronectin-binding autotransporter adhesin
MAAFQKTIGVKGQLVSCSGQMIRRRSKLSLAAMGVTAGIAWSIGSAASAQTATLYTTTSDFTGWTNSPGVSNSVESDTAFDSDGSSTNGAGNLTSPGGTSTAGSLEIDTGSNALGYGKLALGPNEASNTTFLTDIDPGSTSTNLVAYSGTLTLTYTTPTWGSTTVYSNVGLYFSVNGSGPTGSAPYFYYNAGGSSTTSTVDGQATTTAKIPYTISAGAITSGFQLGLWANDGDYGGNGGNIAQEPIYVDDITVPSPVVVPANNATWGTNGAGTWEIAADWANSTPPANNASNATFDTDGGAITSTTTVTLGQNEVINNLTFNSPKGYDLAGTTTLFVGGALNSLQGTNTITNLNLQNSSQLLSSSPSSTLTVGSLTHNDYSTINFAGGGTINITAMASGDAYGNLEVGGGTTLNLGNSTLTSSNSFFYDMTATTTADTINLGTGNVVTNNSMGGSGTIIIGAGTSLTTDQYGGFYFGGSLSGSGNLTMGSNASTSGNGTGYVGTFGSTSPNFSGAIDVAWDSTLGLGNGATLGNGSGSNTITLDSGQVQVYGGVDVTGNTAMAVPSTVTLVQNILLEDTQDLVNNVTAVNTESDITYTISNTTFTMAVANTLTLSGQISGPNELQKNGIGTLILSGSNSYGGGTNVTGGTLVAGATGALPANSALTISNGSLVQIANTGSANVQTLGSLSIDPTSKLDLTNNHMYIVYGGGSDPMTTIYGYLKSGFNNGAWNGTTGIISSTAQTATNGLHYGIGWADGNDGTHKVSNTLLSSGEILLKYTLLGDANLDGSVNGTDFSTLAANFGLGVTNWDLGNFLYGSSVNGSDFSALAANFGQGDNGADVSVSPADIAALDAFAAANGLPSPTIAAVPEPATLGILALGAGGLAVRRRRK